MPSLDTMRRISQMKYNGAKTIGQIHKETSDWHMEDSWECDISSKVCYIYDYFHDDQPDKKDHITYNNTTKTKIDAKFIVAKYPSIDKDQVEYHIQFRPSQKVEFEPSDEMYYFEEQYRERYGNVWPVGFYCDIPDEKGVYRKWLIVSKGDGNQFIKYSVLPCDYRLCWIEKNGHERTKRRMWGCQRQQNSYTIGEYTDVRFTRLDNQSKIWLPLNSITEKIWYTNDESKNMRVIVSAPTDHPIAWTITKVENAAPLGIQKLTLYQNFFDQHRDHMERDNNGKIIGMWADYFDYDTTVKDEDNQSMEELLSSIKAKIHASTNTIKVGGSYKLLTVNVFDGNEDITEKFSTASNNSIIWNCSIDGDDCSDLVKWLTQKEFNKIKIKVSDNREYLDKILKIECSVPNGKEFINAEMELQLTI